MTQETNHLTAGTIQSIEDKTLENLKQETYMNLKALRSSLQTKSSNAKILAILQVCPCSVKCAHEIKSSTYNNNFDSLWGGKHEYAKGKLIDAIVDRFADLVSITSEHATPTGKLDIVIEQGSKITLKYNKKVIAIELKSGKTADASMLCQVERYLPDCDILLFIRIPTEEVTMIEREPIEKNLIEGLSRLNRKIRRITKGDLIKVQGDWCRGCTVDCTHKKEPRWTGESKASLENFGNFYKNIEKVISKTLEILEKEIYPAKSSIDK